MLRQLILTCSSLFLSCTTLFHLSSILLASTTGTCSTMRFTHGFTYETDMEALLAIKNQILEDPFKVLNSWNKSLHFCDWQGVTCSRRHERVSVLNLSSLQLVGTLSPHIGNLTFLNSIYLYNNSFHGRIPQEMGRLFRLQYLSLYTNSFEGELPTGLTNCSNIKLLDLFQNNLVGEIPAELGSLSNLEELFLASNNFIGTIPPSFGNLTALSRLVLYANNLEGSIPPELGQLSNLELIHLGLNNLSGVIPASLYNFSSLFFFAVALNKLHGNLYPNFGLSLPKLQIFYFGGNQFSGTIPPSIANASELAEIDIGSNNFTGSVPMNLGSLQNLEIFSVSNNLLGSNEVNNDFSFLTSLTNCSNLKQLWLGNNQFRGVFPNSIANLSTTLIKLALHGNPIHGHIPPEIANLINLTLVSLGDSMITGPIPDSIGKLTNLEVCELHASNLSGRIPSSIGNNTRLNTLSLYKNMLEGDIPFSLGKCINLQTLDLSHNRLTGEIPKQILGLSSLSIGLILAYNFLSGPLPTQVGGMTNVGTLDVSENKLSGEIPSTLSKCQVLEFLNMEGNHFEGAIPSSFEQLKGIRVLDLSRNNLSGQIPSFLGKFTIESLNLSYNMFDGEVPIEGVFRNISAFSIMGNSNLCGGIEALRLPACPTKVLEKRRKHLSVGVTIALVMTLVVLLLVGLLVILHRIKRSRQQTLLALPLEDRYPKLSHAELLQATNGFSSTNLLGGGRYGSVYKGILKSRIVAVKVFKLQESGANRSFTAECEALRNIRHRNLVKIITSCSSIDYSGNDFKALVFEFMPNESLEDWLHPVSSEQLDQKNLNLIQRINIAIDVASALDYLHNHCETRISHCDLKPSNILLDDDFCAHVGDFGLARILLASMGESNYAHSTSIGIRGTIGYIAPEYGMSGEVSTQGDVYSYGILLIEMFTGKRPTSNTFTNNSSLHNYTKMALPDRVMDIVDPRLLMEDEGGSNGTRQGQRGNIVGIEACVASILQIGVSCSVESPSERKDIKDVLIELHGIRNVFLKA